MSRSSTRLLATGRLFMGAAAAVALYLALMSLGGIALPGCVEGSECQDVLRSRWGYVFGLPVSFAGFIVCSGLMMAGRDFVQRSRSLAGLTATAATLWIPAAGAWFTWVQLDFISAFCLWCSLVHGLGFTGVMLLWLSRLTFQPGRSKEQPPSHLAASITTGMALAGIAILATGPFYGPSPSIAWQSAQTASPNLRDMTASAAAQIDPSAYPSIGDADAPVTALVLSDFTNPQSLALHAALDALLKRRSGSFRAVVLPVGETPDAAAIQKTMLTLWHVSPAKWRTAAALLSSGQIRPVPLEVETAAVNLAGKNAFSTAAFDFAIRIDGQLAAAAAMASEHRHTDSQAQLPVLIRDAQSLLWDGHNTAKLEAFLCDRTTPQANKATPASDAKPAAVPVLAMATSSIDLNGMTRGQPVDVEIKLQNKGTAPLLLNWLETDTGCFVTSLPDGPVPPGGSAAIGLKIHPPENVGAINNRSIRIHSNAPGAPGEYVIRSTLLMTGQSAPGPAPIAESKTPGPGNRAPAAR